MIHTGQPNDTALLSGTLRMTYAEMDGLVAETVRDFQDRGIEPGDRVALYHDDTPRYIVQLRAVMKMGAVACPVSTRWPESKMREATRRIGAKMIEFSDRHEMLKATSTLDADKAATIIFTSGSSGTPKAAVHSLSNHLESARASNRNIALAPDDGWLSSLPLYHVGGLGIIFRCFQGGATIVVPERDQSLEASILDERVTHISLVSTQLYRLLESEESIAALAKMKGVLMGGSAMPDQLIARALEAGVPIHTSYGMTEMATQITCTLPGADLETLRTSGSPIIEGNVSVFSNGEIHINGPTRFMGYLTESAKLELPLTDDGWFATGDRGYLDDLGRLHVTGRMDNQFISGGENIQPEEIEHALCQIDGIQQTVVVPIEDEEFGQRPVAFVRAVSDWDEAEVKTILRETLPGFMIPARVLEWPRELIPEGMKVDRNAMRNHAADI